MSLFNYGTKPGTGATGSSNGLALGCIGLWLFNEGSGTTVHDYSSQAKHGTWFGTTTSVWATDPLFGSVGHFNGTNNWVNLGGWWGPTGDIAYTISMWVKPISLQDDNCYFGTGNGGTNDEVLFFGVQGSGRLLVRHWGDDYEFDDGNGAISSGVWSHIAITSDSGSNQDNLYINGQFRAMRFRNGLNIQGITNNTKIGQHPYDSNVIGETYISMVAVHNRYCDPEEMQQLYYDSYQMLSGFNSNIPASFPSLTQQPMPGLGLNERTVLTRDLVAFYPFNDGSGQNVRDLSHYHNDGTWQGTMYGPGFQWTPSERGWAGFFDGSTNYVSAQSTIPWSGNVSFTLSMWIYMFTFNNDAAFLSYGSAGVSQVLALDSSDRGRIVSVHYGNDHEYGWSYARAQWQHILTTYDGTTEKLYIDGLYKEQWNPSPLSIQPNDVINISRSSWNGNIAGDAYLQALSIHARVMSPEEVKLLYTNTYDMVAKPLEYDAILYGTAGFANLHFASALTHTNIVGTPINITTVLTLGGAITTSNLVGIPVNATTILAMNTAFTTSTLNGNITFTSPHLVLFSDNFASGGITNWTSGNAPISTITSNYGAGNVTEKVAHFNSATLHTLVKNFTPDYTSNIVDATIIIDLFPTSGTHGFYGDAYDYFNYLCGFTCTNGSNSVLCAELRIDQIGNLCLVVNNSDGSQRVIIGPNIWVLDGVVSTVNHPNQQKIDLVVDYSGEYPIYIVGLADVMHIKYVDTSFVGTIANLPLLPTSFFVYHPVVSDTTRNTKPMNLYSCVISNYNSIAIAFILNPTVHRLLGGSEAVNYASTSYGTLQTNLLTSRVNEASNIYIADSSTSGIEAHILYMDKFDNMVSYANEYTYATFLDYGYTFQPSSGRQPTQDTDPSAETIQFGPVYEYTEDQISSLSTVGYAAMLYGIMNKSKLSYASDRSVIVSNISTGVNTWNAKPTLIDGIVPYNKLLQTNVDGSSLTFTLPRAGTSEFTSLYIGYLAPHVSQGSLSVYVNSILMETWSLGTAYPANPALFKQFFNVINSSPLPFYSIPSTIEDQMEVFYTWQQSGSDWVGEPTQHKDNSTLPTIRRIGNVQNTNPIIVTIVYHNPTTAYANGVWMHFVAGLNALPQDKQVIIDTTFSNTSSGVILNNSELWDEGAQSLVQDLSLDSVHVAMMEDLDIYAEDINTSPSFTSPTGIPGLQSMSTASTNMVNYITAVITDTSAHFVYPQYINGVGSATASLATTVHSSSESFTPFAPTIYGDSSAIDPDLFGVGTASCALAPNIFFVDTGLVLHDLEILPLYGHGTAFATLQRTSNALPSVVVYGYVYDGELNPIESVNIQVIPSISGSDSLLPVDSVTLVQESRIVGTDSTGLWQVELIAPSTVTLYSNNGDTVLRYTFIIDVGGREPVIVNTTSFEYSLSPISIGDILDLDSTISTVPMIGYIGDANGKPIASQQVTASLAFDDTYDSLYTISSNEVVTTLTDNNGFYSLPCIPQSLLDSGNSYYLIAESPNTIKYVRIPDTGGYVWDNIVAIVPVDTEFIDPSLITADFQEGSTYEVPVQSDSLIVNLDNIRSIIGALEHTIPWSVIPVHEALGVGVTSPQTGFIAISNTTHADVVTSNKFGSTLNTLNVAIGIDSGVGSSIISHAGNRMHGFVSWTNGASNWCAGVQLLGTFSTNGVDFSKASMRLFPANAATAKALYTNGVYTTFSDTGFNINFTVPINTATTFAITYQIEGALWT